ncbi:hypothetical protein [Minwuia sp.]|uniref:hypothetical protein n=1 Tax=Minwuia sp. TaxID=2493630 RepID=UPI003A94F69B
MAADYLELNRGVVAGDQDDENDIVQTKSLLAESGDYKPVGGRITPWRDPELNDAIKKVQVRNRIWPDGEMRPKKATHRIINAEKKERDQGFKTPPFNLTGSVGTGQSNRPEDVRRVRGALGRLGYLDQSEALQPKDSFDQKLDYGLRGVQRDYNRKVDGVAHQKGETASLLGRVTAPLSPAARALSGQQSTSALKQKDVHWMDATMESVKEIAGSVGKVASDQVGRAAMKALRESARKAEEEGLVHGPRNLNHFLDATWT